MIDRDFFSVENEHVSVSEQWEAKKTETNEKSVCRYFLVLFRFVLFCFVLFNKIVNEWTFVAATKNKLVLVYIMWERKIEEATNEVEILPIDTEWSVALFIVDDATNSHKHTHTQTTSLMTFNTHSVEWSFRS